MYIYVCVCVYIYTHRHTYIRYYRKIQVNILAHPIYVYGASQVVLVAKYPPANAGDVRDTGLIPGLGGGHSNLLQYSCLENPMDRGARQAAVHGVTQSWTQLKRLSVHICIWGFPGGSDSKESACYAGDPGSIPGVGRCPGYGTVPPVLHYYVYKFEGISICKMCTHSLIVSIHTHMCWRNFFLPYHIFYCWSLKLFFPLDLKERLLTEPLLISLSFV